MKQSLLICAAAALLAGSSCSEQEPFDAAMPVRLSVAGISPGSRAAANYAADDYFGLRGMAGASVSVKARTTTYIYADGTLAGATPDDVLYFPVDGSALASVKVYWPEEAVRQAQGGAIAKDQREKEAFLAADWLSAELKEVAPAQAVALTLGTIGVGSWDEGAGGTAQGMTPTHYRIEGLENRTIEVYLAGSDSPTQITLDAKGEAMQQAGGICGQLNAGATISSCYNAGKVGAKWNSGGIAGQSTDAEIIACHNDGLIESQTSGWAGAGGICGFHKGTITACYHIGQVTGDSAIGAIVGEHNSGNISYCYWNGDLEGIPAGGGGSQTGNAKFGAAWPQPSTHEAWRTTADTPAAYWRTLGSAGGGYPKLAWEK